MTCGRVYGGVLLTVAAAGVFLSVVGVAEVSLRVFSSAPVVAVVSAALGWRLALLAAALLALFLVALAAGWFSAAGGLRGALPGWLAAWGAEALGAGRVWRRCRLRDVWFGPRFRFCAAAT